MTDFKTPADLMVERLAELTQKAIDRRAVRHCKSNIVRVDDVKEAARRLFIGGRWPQEILDELN